MRFGRQALDDLDVDRGVAPDDHDRIRSQAKCREIVDKFLAHYSETREPTGAGYVNNVGGNVHKLKSGSRNRACVKVHEAGSTVWFLGFTDAHDYHLFEQRHANGILYPSDAELAEAIAARRSESFEDRVSPGLRELVDRAAEEPGSPQRGTVGGMLRLEVSVLVVEVDDEGLADVFIAVQMPPEGDPGAVEGWPGNQLLPVLADASRVAFVSMNYPTHVPDGQGSLRAVRLGHEHAVQLTDVDVKGLRQCT